MFFRKHCLYIYADGSSFSKPRKGGVGILYVFLDENEMEQRVFLDQSGYEGATNNQMELMAVIEGLRQASKQKIPISYDSIEVRTDSRYVVDNKNNAIYFWSKNKWLNRNGRPIENAQLWKELIKAIKTNNCRVEIKWVKGHSKDMNNKAVDKLAKESARGFLNPPLTQIKLRRKKSKRTTRPGCIEMKGQRIAIHIISDEYLHIQRLSKYRYEVLSKRSEFYENVDIIFSELHHLKSGHKYSVRLNSDSKNPRILKMIKEIDSNKIE